MTKFKSLVSDEDVEQYNPEVNGRCHLHMGLSLPDAKRLVEFVKDQATMTPALPVYVDGDGWNCWGEAVGSDINDESTYHVIIPVESPRAGQQLVLTLLDHQFGFERLVAMEQPWWPADAVGVIGVVTDGVDWAEYQHSLSWEEQDGQSTPSGVYISEWPRGRKAYHLEIADEDTEALENWLASRSAEVVDVVDIDSGTPGVKS